jgi:predicted DNA binding CopG/RHH family protein
MNNLTEEEKDILESFEKGEWHSKGNIEQRKKELQEYAQNTLKKGKRINIKISENDLEAIKIMALDEGIPFKILIASIVHKYVSGKLIEGSKATHKL